jgi:hypothetical protein
MHTVCTARRDIGIGISACINRKRNLIRGMKKIDECHINDSRHPLMIRQFNIASNRSNATIG